MSSDLSGKVFLVTGATSGIGKETARALASRGGTVVLVARSREKGAQTLQELQAVNPNARLEVLYADLSSQRQIRALAEEFKRKYDRLDVLVNNAGAIFPDRLTTEDGIEATFATNHLAYFLLTNLLLDLLRKSAPSRIVNVASEGQRIARLQLDDLQFTQRRYASVAAYAQSKLANILFTYELARRLEGTGVTVNAVHPGHPKTGFGAGGRGLYKLAWTFFRRFSTPPEEGAKTSIALATAPELEGVTGKYFGEHGEELKSRKGSYDPETWRRLWEASEALTAEKPVGS